MFRVILCSYQNLDKKRQKQKKKIVEIEVGRDIQESSINTRRYKPISQNIPKVRRFIDFKRNDKTIYKSK